MLLSTVNGVHLCFTCRPKDEPLEKALGRLAKTLATKPGSKLAACATCLQLCVRGGGGQREGTGGKLCRACHGHGRRQAAHARACSPPCASRHASSDVGTRWRGMRRGACWQRRTQVIAPASAPMHSLTQMCALLHWPACARLHACVQRRTRRRASAPQRSRRRSPERRAQPYMRM